MHTLKDKVSLITGGANGIGAKVVKEFIKEGVKREGNLISTAQDILVWVSVSQLYAENKSVLTRIVISSIRHIAILDIDETSGVALEKEINSKYGEGKSKFYKCDVTKDEELFDAYDKTMETFGVIDVVVNNAGIACDLPNVYKKEININFTATVTSTFKALQLMRVDEGGKGGTIINISSIAALGLYSPNIFVYSATKCAVLHYSACIGKEEYYRFTNVRVITMCYGLTDTDIINEMQCYDKLSTKILNCNIGLIRNRGEIQTGEAAAKGLVMAYENGKTGSTWAVDNNKTSEISNNINEAFNLMSRNISVEYIV